MKVVILAGGKGERLYPETEVVPKPMVRIGGKPILWHIMKIYSAYGINDFIICAGYKGNVIKEYFVNYFLHNYDVTVDLKKGVVEYHYREVEPWRVTVVDTGEDTETGGRLRRVREYLEGEEYFCLTYGDCLCNANIREEIEFHKKHGKLLTALAPKYTMRYTEWKILENKIEFISPSIISSDEERGWFCGGFFVVSAQVLDWIEGDATDWNKVIFKLNSANQLRAFRHKGFWYSLETLKDKIYLEELWNSGKAPWKVW